MLTYSFAAAVYACADAAARSCPGALPEDIVDELAMTDPERAATVYRWARELTRWGAYWADDTSLEQARAEGHPCVWREDER